jgi:hypothetical protein
MQTQFYHFYAFLLASFLTLMLAPLAFPYYTHIDSSPIDFNDLLKEAGFVEGELCELKL